MGVGNRNSLLQRLVGEGTSPLRLGAWNRKGFLSGFCIAVVIHSLDPTKVGGRGNLAPTVGRMESEGISIRILYRGRYPLA